MYTKVCHLSEHIPVALAIEGRVGTTGGLSTPGQGQGEGPVGYKFRRKRERSRQWEGPEWSEAERSPPGVPTLPYKRFRQLFDYRKYKRNAPG